MPEDRQLPEPLVRWQRRKLWLRPALAWLPARPALPRPVVLQALQVLPPAELRRPVLPEPLQAQLAVRQAARLPVPRPDPWLARSGWALAP